MATNSIAISIENSKFDNLSIKTKQYKLNPLQNTQHYRRK